MICQRHLIFKNQTVCIVSFVEINISTPKDFHTYGVPLNSNCGEPNAFTCSFLAHRCLKMTENDAPLPLNSNLETIVHHFQSYSNDGGPEMNR